MKNNDVSLLIKICISIAVSVPLDYPEVPLLLMGSFFAIIKLPNKKPRQGTP